MTNSEIDTFIGCAFALLAAFVFGLVIGSLDLSGERHDQPKHPNVVVCHSETQTNCLWVDGTATWH